jgi:MFS family permease
MGSMSGAALRQAGAQPMTAQDKRVVIASSLGTVFEWYDFYLYGAMTAIIARQFFSGLDPQAAFVFALLAFAAGFIVRPFGALLFGQLGDTMGRKYTFLLTMLVMGLSTVVVGLLPSYESVGVMAPLMLILLRLLQGLALGGEYGGAATYVAEHAPPGKRGTYTSWVQTTASLGLLLSLLVILATRALVGEVAFEEWGWRLPFLGSFALLAVSLWIRLGMTESPAFRQIKTEGRTSKAPLSESFGQWKNLKTVVLALLGLTAGQAVVWYTGQFYALLFLQNVLKVDAAAADVLVAASIGLGAPFFVVFGALSDRIGRKPIIMAGLALAALTYFPLFGALTELANPKLAAAQSGARITVTADPAQCSLQLNPVARDVDFASACDIARRSLAQASASYETVARPGAATQVRIGEKLIDVPAGVLVASGHRFDEPSRKAIALFRKDVAQAMTAAGYPAHADPIEAGSPAWCKLVAILTVLVVYGTMVYGPLAAMLVEMFPTRIRYTSMSLPYHIGNGWFGGLMPTIAFAMVAHNGNIFHGLWYPVGVAVLTLVIGMIFLRETKDRELSVAGQAD